MDVKKIITKTLAEYFVPNVVNDFIELTNNGKLSKENFIDLISNKYSYEKQVLNYFAKCEKSDITNLSDVVDKFGIELCAFVIFNISLFEQLSKNRLKEGFIQMFEKGLFTAVASYYIAKTANIKSPWKAYLSGLYSNISYFFLYKHYPEEFDRLLSTEINSINRMNYEWETFGMTHSDISWYLLGKVGIPEDIRGPVKYHHLKTSKTNCDMKNAEDLCSSVYLGSMLTTVFYENFSLAINFKSEVQNHMNIDIALLDNLVSKIIFEFKIKLNLLDVYDFSLPGYFKLIDLFENKINELDSELIKVKDKLNKEKKQRLKFQKVLESYNKKLVGIAIKDPLTGIYNRRYLTERLNDEFIKATKYNSSFLIITCDIDHFKKINDTYGHGFGDVVLVQLVEVIAKTIRKTDLLARIGGEEFIILCNQSNDYDGILIAEKVRSQIEKTVFMFEKNTRVHVTMSFGVANFNKDIKSVQELMELSDNRLYLAKRNGRNRVVYTDSTNEALM
ncbi:MAG: diguanylate cyclase [Candidatus Delongbacteria bacterium]|jgi:diguanylate cyclase (GGDEF)-like protein|nr:diguanylate cyclase [Candidatus Delongbacteria bacterium]